MRRSKVMNKKISVAAAMLGVVIITTGCSSLEQICPKDKVAKKKTAQVKVVANMDDVKVIKNKDFKVIFQDIHFNFDKYNLTMIDKYGIKQNVPAVLDVMAKFMSGNPDITIKIEGNCDERGTEEYNLALGKKRAESAKQYLISKGIAPKRIETISYGESRPLDPEHNQEAWAKNRRDHFVILSR
jgi:peptidoglycan-associated lipoprotein